MEVTPIVASSLLQTVAVCLALRLIRAPRQRLAWTLISAALLFMSIRQSDSLFRILIGEISFFSDSMDEAFDLAILAFMVAGLAWVSSRAAIGCSENEIADDNNILKRETAKRRQAEDELEKSRTLLLHAQKLSTTGKLVASIVHEFNTPIHGIGAILGQLVAEAPMDVKNKDCVNLALKECHRIARLIKELQHFHRPSSGVAAPMKIHEAIDEMARLVEKKLMQGKIKLEKYYTEPMPQITAVSDQIRQVILNLIQNAEEAIPKGGGMITIATEIFNSTVKIKFQDTGSGIEPENMASLFDPFFTTKPAVKGTGLGLLSATA